MNFITPIKAVINSDGNIYICSNYKVFVHQFEKLDTYLLAEFIVCSEWWGVEIFTSHMQSEMYYSKAVDK